MTATLVQDRVRLDFGLGAFAFLLTVSLWLWFASGRWSGPDTFGQN